MFKKIKKYFEFQRRYRHELLETMATICLYLDYDGRRNPYRDHMVGHFQELKQLSEELRKHREEPKR